MPFEQLCEADGGSLAVLLERLDDSAAIVDAHGRILMTNRRDELPASLSSITMKDMGEVLRIFRSDGRPYDTAEWPVFRSLRTGEVIADEEFFRLEHDGSRRSFRCSSAPFHGRDGRIAGAIVIARDVTERKHMEEQLAYLIPLLDHSEDAVFAADAQSRVTAWNRGAERMYGWTPEEAVGKSLTFMWDGWSAERRAARLRDLSEHGRWRGQGPAERKDGSPIRVEAITVGIPGSKGETTGYLAIHRDISERIRAQEQLENAALEQSLLADLSLRALRNRELQVLLDEAVTMLAGVLKVELCAIAELEVEEGVPRWRSTFGWTQEEIAAGPLSGAGTESLVGYTIMVGAPVVSQDVTEDDRFDISTTFAEPPPVSAATVVIPGPRGPFGVLVVATRTRRSFAPDEVKFMQATANVMGIGIERAEEGERIEAARESERTRIARELHDDGLRELTEALGLTSFARSTATDERDGRRWAELGVSLRRVGQHLRSAIYNLRLGTHEERAFVDLLDELVAVQTELAQDCRVVLRGGDKLPAASLGRRGTEALRIVSEAITNARHHSGAKVIRVDSGASTPERLRIQVSDDGRWPGRERVVSSRRGTGILGMVERAEEIGANLRIEGPVTGGTTVSLELSLRLPGGGT